MRAPRAIVIASPGGIARGGGMGSVTRAMHGWLVEDAPQTRVFVIDPHGSGSALVWPLRLLLTMLQLAWLRVFRGADILHLQISEGGSFLRKGLLLRLGKLLGMRVVLHHHGARLRPFLVSARGVKRVFIQRTIRLADLNLVLGEGVKRLLAEHGGLRGERGIVLCNACPDPGYRTGLEGRAHFLVSAVLTPRKGIDDFLKAMALLVARGYDVTATLAGGGEVARYSALAETLGLNDRVRFTGWLPPASIFELHGRSRALVLPSFDEGMPMAIIEALATGLPVIATPVGAIPEMLRHGETALLVPPGDSVELAGAMERIAGDDMLAARLSLQGRQLYERSFGLDRYMRRLLALYAGAPLRQPAGQHQIGDYRGAAALERR
ncbi:hypothetical protein JP74_09205 [Devosia sp. 17-2-E-8]|nr:hypothetical protein JP74_09205 [Devosia sp. 17-2-E-8]